MRAPFLATCAGALAATALAVAFAFGALAGFAPLTSRLLYVHVPAAWVAYLAFAVAAGASIAVLGDRRAERNDLVALAAVEVGALFGAVALVTGIVWARVEFGGDYSLVQDAKLITTLVLELAYLGYLALRRNVDAPPERRRLAAVYGVVALVGVPASYLANRATTPHPDLAGGTGLAGGVWVLLLLATAAFSALFAALARWRFDLAVREALAEVADHD